MLHLQSRARPGAAHIEVKAELKLRSGGDQGELRTRAQDASSGGDQVELQF